MAGPMNNLLRKNAWGWNHEANAAFHIFKRSDDTSTSVGPSRCFRNRSFFNVMPVGQGSVQS